MAKKRKSYGKTTKQWDNLYNRYKDDLKYKRNITKLTKTEFKQAWVNRKKGESVKDLVNKTLTEDSYSQYERIYAKTAKKGYELSDKLSKKAFEQQLPEYGNIKELTESQMFVSRKQAENWSRHAAQIGLDVKVNDFLSMNEKSDEFWAFINANGGWEAVYEYT